MRKLVIASAAFFLASALAQPPAPPPKIKLKVGAEENSIRTLELAPGTYVSLGLSCTGSACAVTINGSASAIPGTVDFSGADHTIVAKTGTTPPSSCTVGEWFFDTDELAGANLKICTSANTWQNLTMTYIPAYTVATLPAPSTAGRLAVVTDANVAGSCTSGGGTALALCRDSGSAWVPLGDGGSGGGGSATGYAMVAPATCQIGGASTSLVLPASGYPTPVCIQGSNVITAALEFSDSETQAVQGQLRLAGTISTIDLQLKWRTTATSGDVVWQIQTACVADGEASDPAWNTAQTIVDAAKGTALQQNDATLTGVTITGCATGETMYWRLLRDPAHASDTISAAAQLLNILWVINR